MENKQSGTASPPIVSPRPIQTQQQPLTADESWKIVGSPPRRPLLSPPEDKERNRVLQETDITTVEGNRTRAIGADLVDLADSTISSLSAGTCNESSSSSSASSISSPTSPTPPQHKLLSHPVLAGQDMGSGLAPLIPPVASGARALSPLDRDSLPDQSATHPMHFKSSSTGTPTSQRTDTTSFSILGQQDLKPVESFHAKSQSLNIGSRGALKQSGTGLESPLSLGSFIWTGTASKDASDLSVTNPKSTHGDIISTGIPRTARSLSFSDSGFANTFRLPTTKLGLDLDEDDLLRYRPPLPTMEEEAEDALEPRINRARSFSTSATFGSDAFTGGLSMFSSPDSQDSFTASARSLRGSESALGGDNRLLLHRESPGGSATWPGPVGPDTSLSNHRRSVTSTSAYSAPIWDSFQPLPSPLERQRVARRFSLAPASGFQNYDAFLDDVDAGNSSTMGSLSRHPLDNDLVQQAQRRHSVAGLGGPYHRPNVTPFNLTSSLEALRLNDGDQGKNWSLYEEPFEEIEYQTPGSSAKDLGKGLSLGQLPNCGSLYVVEFKAGRNDLFYIGENSGVSLKIGDLVIVEADRGKDLGKITNDSITPQQIQAMQAQQAEIAALQAHQDGSGGGSGSSNNNGTGGHRAPKEIHPKRIFRLAQSSEISQLVNKNQDEVKAMMVCQTKVRQKRLPMEVVDAEYQWDRRKLTFYFIAERRIDFRELVRDLFKIYKTRIWMFAVNPSMVQSSTMGLPSQTSSPPPMSPGPVHQQQHQQLHQHSQGPPAVNSPTSPRLPHIDRQPSPMNPMNSYHFSQLSQQYQPQHAQYSQYPQYPQVPLHFQQQHQQHQQHQQQLVAAHHRAPQSFYGLQSSSLPPLSSPSHPHQSHSYPYPSLNP